MNLLINGRSNEKMFSAGLAEENERGEVRFE